MNRIIGLLPILVLGSAPVAEAQSAGSAQESPFVKTKHRISLGMAEQNASAGISATAEGFEPISLRIDDLGLEDQDYSYYLDYRYRFRPKWALIAASYSFSDSGSQRAEKDFNYDGVDYTAGAQLDTELDVDAYILDLLYALHRSERLEFMIGGGIHALDLGAAIAARVSLNEREASSSASGTTVLAPVPNIRFSGAWTLTDRIVAEATGGWLSANIDDFSGDFVYAHLRLAYELTDRFSLALGYQRTDIDITQSLARTTVNYDVRLNGITATFAVSF